MKPSNPFLISGYISPEYFCNRENESAKIINALVNNRNVTLFSFRRIGKTQLIHHSFYQLRKEKDIRIFYIDILPTTNLIEFLNLLGNEILGKLDSKPIQLLKKINKILYGIRLTINYDSLTGQPSIQFDIRNENEANQTLQQIFKYMNTQKWKIVIAIDEFQQITNYPEKKVESLLRTYIQKMKNVNFIFSGSHKHLLLSMFSNQNRPFYQSTELMHLDKLNKLEYKKFILKHFSNNSISIKENDIDFILEWTKNHTFYSQFVFNKIYSAGFRLLNNMKIKEIINSILIENEQLYLSLRNIITEYQWKLLKAIAKEGNIKKITSSQFIQKYNLNAPSSVKTAIKSLLEKELIYTDNNEYLVYDVFFERWLEKLP